MTFGSQSIRERAIWTHRGSPHPEHTRLAFESAWNDGIRHFEVDIRKTKDHIVVLAHDSSIKRVAGIDLKIEELSFEQLQQYQIAGENWMTLVELLESFPDASISIDFKSDDVLDRAIAIVREFPQSKLVLGSFSAKRTKVLRREFPHHASAATALEVLSMRLGYLPRAIRKRMIYAMVPRQHKGIEVLTNKFIATCQSANVPIYVWVVNDPHEMLELFDLGISGVVTDCYEKMLGNIKH